MNHTQHPPLFSRFRDDINNQAGPCKRPRSSDDEDDFEFGTSFDWQYHQDHGFVHPPHAECHVCNQYVDHVQENRSFKAFQRAKQQRDETIVQYGKEVEDHLRVELKEEHAVATEQLAQQLEEKQVALSTTIRALSLAQKQLEQVEEECSNLRRKASSKALFFDMSNIDDINKLMAEAQIPGNHAHVTAMRRLCNKAHKTSKRDKTYIHHYVLEHWRLPQWKSRGVKEEPTEPSLGFDFGETSTSFEPSTCLAPMRHRETRVASDSRRREGARTRVTDSYVPSYSSSFPLGVGCHSNGKPVRNDLDAYDLVNNLGPKGNTRLEAKERYMDLASTLFQTTEKYERILHDTKTQIAPGKRQTSIAGVWTRERGVDAQKQDDRDMQRIAIHFAECGIRVSMVKALERWARQYKRDVQSRDATRLVRRMQR